jgi:hypothetical protein
MSARRVQELIRRLDRLKHRTEPSLNRPEIVAITNAELDAIEPHVMAIEDALKPKAEKLLAGRELWQSLAIAVAGIAHARRSARLNAADLKELIEQHCPGYDVPFWVNQRAPAAAGLLRFEGWEKTVENGVRKVSELRQLIEQRSVIFWDEWQDEQWRIVDTRWLEAHEDIYSWLTDPWGGGRRCRFCAMVENPMVDALRQIELERRNDGATRLGDGTVVLPLGRALTHERCRPHFLDWLAIAAKYSSTLEAAAADKAAGRVSRYEKVVRASALEAPTDE